MGSTAGYRPFAKFLHWSVVAAFAVQFALGYALDASGSGRGRGRSGDSGRGRGRGAEYELFGDEAVLTAHVLVGAGIVVLGATRLMWRRGTTLPPWAPTLTPFERRLAHRTETVLYLLTFVVPLTGVVLLASGDEDLLWVHVAAQAGLLTAVACHVALVLKHQFLDRDRLLRRML
ncbi:cytochrome b/b6 domain-containing protein [Streptomyces sp. A0592]|uniref:cytochrome b n=1 Tax=Streptomyces sp. A0592 TaxID=2563099 RepID=UPI0014470A5A|nr:cytochrome b/b6 domain-containing protein [Streptomyces sp. A0592]